MGNLCYVKFLQASAIPFFPWWSHRKSTDNALSGLHTALGGGQGGGGEAPSIALETPLGNCELGWSHFSHNHENVASFAPFLRMWPLSPCFCIHIAQHRTGKDSLLHSLQQNPTHPGFFLSLESRSAFWPLPSPTSCKLLSRSLPRKETRCHWTELGRNQAAWGWSWVQESVAVLLRFPGSIMSRSPQGCSWSPPRCFLVCKQLKSCSCPILYF